METDYRIIQDNALTQECERDRIREQAKADAFEASLWPIRVLRPSLMADGDQWCFLAGSNLAEGIAGFGSTVEEAAVVLCRAVEKQECGKPVPRKAQSTEGRGK